MSNKILTTAEQQSAIATSYWQPLADGRIQCDMCPRLCKLHDGQRGLCFVRARWNNQIVLTTYGRSSGFCIDPIEKKPLNHFLPGTPVLSFGTAGCNLSCKFCQNWDISKSKQWDDLADAASPLKLALAAKQTQCRSVAYTYNDPVIFHEYAIDVAAACSEMGINNIAVTAGYINPEPRASFFAAMQATNVDLKCFDEDFYKRVCGAHLEQVLDTLLYIKHETDCWLEVTNLLIPGKNDSSAELEALCQWFVENLGAHVPLHFTAFHPDWKMRDLPNTPIETLQRARGIAKTAGIQHVYVGNVHDASGSSSYCSNCQKQVITRDWYQLGDWHLDDTGHCQYCGTAMAGVFQGPPGDWGRKRQALQFKPA